MDVEEKQERSMCLQHARLLCEIPVVNQLAREEVGLVVGLVAELSSWRSSCRGSRGRAGCEEMGK